LWVIFGQKTTPFPGFAEHSAESWPQTDPLKARPHDRKFVWSAPPGAVTRHAHLPTNFAHAATRRTHAATHPAHAPTRYRDGAPTHRLGRARRLANAMTRCSHPPTRRSRTNATLPRSESDATRRVKRMRCDYSAIRRAFSATRRRDATRLGRAHAARDAPQATTTVVRSDALIDSDVAVTTRPRNDATTQRRNDATTQRRNDATTQRRNDSDTTTQRRNDSDTTTQRRSDTTTK
jgi:hypothetical protein